MRLVELFISIGFVLLYEEQCILSLLLNREFPAGNKLTTSALAPHEIGCSLSLEGSSRSGIGEGQVSGSTLGLERLCCWVGGHILCRINHASVPFCLFPSAPFRDRDRLNILLANARRLRCALSPCSVPLPAPFVQPGRRGKHQTQLFALALNELEACCWLVIYDVNFRS